MAEFAALPVFTDALVADTSHLSHVEFGIYFRLLMLMWRSPQCRIPADKDWIIRRMNCPWELLDPIIQEFCQWGTNWVTQKRLTKEFEYTKEKRKKSVASANARWNKDKVPCERNAPSPSPSPSPTKEKNILKKEVSARKVFEADDLSGMAGWFEKTAPNVNPQTVRESLLDWCDAKGRVYKDYYAALRNWAKSEQSKLGGLPNGRNITTNSSANGVAGPITAIGFGGRKSQTQLASETTERIKRERLAKAGIDPRQPNPSKSVE